MTFCAISFQLESSFQFVLFIYLPPISSAKPRARPTIIFFQERSPLTQVNHSMEFKIGLNYFKLEKFAWSCSRLSFSNRFFYHPLFSKSKNQAFGLCARTKYRVVYTYLGGWHSYECHSSSHLAANQDIIFSWSIWAIPVQETVLQIKLLSCKCIWTILVLLHISKSVLAVQGN